MPRLPSPMIGVLSMAFASLLPLPAHAGQPGGPLQAPGLEARVDEIVKKMTLEEKIGQLVQYSSGIPTGPGTGRGAYEEMVAKGLVGSFLNVTGAAETNVLQRIAMKRSRLGIPLLFGLDVIHGYRTVFPTPLAMAATWEPSLVERAARIAAVEASAAGVRWTFSPMVDVARDARWGRIVEGAGEDPHLGAAMARAYVRGYQGTSLADPTSIAACAKHFVAYGAAEAGRDYSPADMSETLLRQVYLPPFRAAVDAGVVTLMSAFNTIGGVPASGNPFMLNRVLRGEWGFRGFVVSDWNSVGELIPHGIALDRPGAARKGLMSGVDMDMEANLYATEIQALVKNGVVPEAVVEEAARRVLRVKVALGLFENPYTPEKSAAGAPIPADHREAARTIAERSFVLLKNEAVEGGRPILPLAAGRSTVALIGPLADSRVDMLGSWPGKGDVKDVVTLRTALQTRLASDGGRLVHARGTEIRGSSESGFAEAVDAARKSDVALVTLGEEAATMTGEAASRTDLGLPGNQQQLLEAVVAVGKPTVVVLFSGRPLTIGWAVRNVPAILQAWHPGIEAGPGLVRTLFGESNPGGKLTVTFPRSVGQVPLYYNHLNTGRPVPAGTDLSRPPEKPEDKYLSRYIDSPNAPLYPFGHGLSYTRFSYGPVELSTRAASAREMDRGTGKPITVTARVTNVGDRPGDETVQLYIGQRGTSVARPVRELVGFQKVALGPGQSVRVSFILGRESLAFWNIDLKHVVEPAHVTVWVGGSSVDGQKAELIVGP
ncbi:MAG: glycoside hydrolase family 3 C-terminal domain-containing protein [Candidatus Riflebacteria bacterium]|nr:glycoside hydrolase family 3 C-terminal domain-containing protein [Candidatus Riflebacteria bacterium]